VATQPADAIEVFYSYSHKDEELRDQLENHLVMLKRDGVIQGWHDRRIIAGQEWDGEIDAHLKSADIILLLVSSDFLASNYCYDIEVKLAMERHEAKEARVIPVILRSCDWTTAPFGRLQGLPKDAIPVRKWSDQDDAFLDIAQGIRRAAGEIRTAKEKAAQPETSSLTDTVKPAPRLNIPDILRVEFVPRKDQSGDDIVAHLKDELAPGKGRLIALWGAGGVGKTVLAIETARALAGAFAERIVWVNADGRADFNLSMLLDAIATQLGDDDLRKLALEPKKEQVRELVAAAPTLVVLDNFETIEPEEGKVCAEWLAQPALCSALITTRDRVENAARNIPVNPMLPDEAHNLLRQLIAQAHEPRAFARLDRDDLIRTAEANPLVLQWIVGQIDLAQDPQEVLEDLRHGEGTAAERVFARSFKLKQLDNGGRAVLLALSLFVPSATRKALAGVSGLGKESDRKQFRDAVRNLSALWLIRPTEDNSRLAVEGLTRELTKAHLSVDQRNKTLCQRFTARFLSYAEAKRTPTAEHLNAMEAEKDNILNAIDVAFEMSDWNSLMRIDSAMHGFLQVRGYWDEAIRRGEQALEVARNLSDERMIGVFTHNVAITHQRRGNQSKARRLYGESLEINKKLGNQRGIAGTLHNIAALAQNQGELDEAQQLYDEGLEINKKLGDQRGIARLLHALGSLARSQGELGEARRLYDESLEISKKLGNQRSIAFSCHQLGTICFDEGDIKESENLFNQSLSILKKLGDKGSTAECLESIGKLRTAQNSLAEAHDLFNDALRIALALNDKFRVASVRRSLGLLAEKENDNLKAAELLREALSGFESLKSPEARATRQDLERVEGASSEGDFTGV